MVPAAPYVVVWQYRVKAGAEEKFIEAYGPSGDWARLFGTAEGYLGTRLAQDTEDAARFVTLDFWESEAAFAKFRNERSADYERLDRQMERWTESEERLGAVQAGKS